MKILNKTRGLFVWIKKSWAEQGIYGVLRLFNKHFLKYPRYLLTILLRSNRRFEFNGKDYPYFFNTYNFSWENERTVEVPIILDQIREFRGKEILEVGNVLSHYLSFKHDILDKYEVASGVINEDVVSFNPKKKYDLIVSISTLEHVGWDEHPKQEDKFDYAIKNLKKLCKSNGKIVVTIPLGHNGYIDNLLMSGKSPFKENYFLRRISKSNKWKQIRREEIAQIVYGSPFPYANILFVGITNNNKY